MNQVIRWKDFDLTARPLPTRDRAIADPRYELWIGAIVAVFFFVLLLGWAAFAPMDAAAYAPGQLQVSGQRQSVQHRDGGIVAAIHVHEGQQVRAGDVLIELKGDEVHGQERALASQMLNLLAQRHRLEAEQVGAATIQWPASFDGVEASSQEVAAAIAVQEQEFGARRTLLAAQAQVLAQQSAQALETARGYGSQVQSSAEQERLIDEELKSLMPVAEKGFVSKSRLRQLERAKAALAGEKGQARAGAGEAELSAGATRLRQLEGEKAYRERATSELKDVVFAIDELMPKYRAAREQARQLNIRAPVSGTVVGLNVFTVGGVIAAGQKLLDVVPDRARLVVTARIAPEDVDDVTVGQEAEVHFVGMHDRGLPLLSGVMTRLSADVLIDEKSGLSFYTAEFEVPDGEIAKIRTVRGPQFRLRAGAPVQVTIPVRKRTALQYAFEPLFGAVQRSGGEH
ncbi:MAG TPA: HlyD family type I secretion periplasmic adaptor subunit [Sphingomicrobium sp.]|jgi:HlyD family secretion protein|nr:HlyD family type I secretion periplasmic adaptor subunit [Sphingomicrobium sp.]